MEPRQFWGQSISFARTGYHRVPGFKSHLKLAASGYDVGCEQKPPLPPQAILGLGMLVLGPRRKKDHDDSIP